jgi:hypothetical protein
VTRGVPEDWTEVFNGACLEADLVEALLSAGGIRVVVQRLDAGLLWPTTVFDQCRVYVPAPQAQVALDLVAEAGQRG